MEPETETTSQTKTIRIFISSPGDVAAERDKAKQVIAQLQNWYGAAVNLVPVLWEELPLEINASFQDGIDVILSGDKGIDIAVFILWSRIGTPVTIGDKTYKSGTEREFDLMLHALEASGGERPDVLFYQRNDDKTFKKKLTLQDDSSEIRRLLNQSELAQAFIQENFWDEQGQNIRAYHSFHQPVEFAGRLKVHLQGLIDRRLEDSGLNREARWADVPYRGLEVFNLEHADIFFGREKEIVELESRLRDRENEEQPCAFVAVIGASGSGKSSLVRAGLRANLTRFNLDESISEWRSMVMMPGQAEGNPIRLLLESLTQPGALPELMLGGLSLDDLAENLVASPTTTINLTIKPLMKGVSGQACPKLLVIVDQFEELFTDKRISGEDRDNFLLILEALAQSGICWVVATMRSDFFHVAQKSEIFLRLKGQSGDGGHFDLLAPGPEALRRIITEPARMAGIRFEKRTPELGGQSVVGKILEDAREQPDMLPLLSDLLLELYQLRSDENVITFAAYESLGDENRTGLEGALSKRAEKEFAKLSDGQRATCPEILHALVTVEADADVRRRANLEALRDTPQRAALVDAFIQARLLTADGPTVSISHEALLRKWDRIADWVRDNRQHLRIRSRVEQAMRRWSNKNNDNSLLLPEGLDLEEGVSLLRDSPHLLAGSEYDGVRDYIQRSRHHHEARARKAKNRRRVVTFFLSVLALGATAGAAYGWWQTQQATEERDKAWFNEGLGWQLRAEVAEERNHRYPDTLLYAAKAIGYAGQGIDENGDPGVIPFIRKDSNSQAFQKAEQWIASRPGYRPVWSENISGAVTGLSVSPHGRYLLVGGKEGSKRWDFAATGNVLEIPAAQAVTIHPGGERFAVADASSVSVHENGKEIKRYEETVTALAYNLSGDFLAGARPDGSVILLGDKVTELGKAGGAATNLVFGPKDATLAAVVPGVGARLFFHHDRALHLSWSKHAGDVTAVAFHPDPKVGRLALGMADGSISIWNVADATRIAEMVPPEKHEGPVTGLDYSPDGTHLISGSEDGLVRLWDANADVPGLLASLTGHVGAVRDVAFFPGGNLVASGGDDGTAKLWEVGDEAKVTDLYSFVHHGWYLFEEETQEAMWDRGTGFLNISPDTLVASWQNGDEKSWGDRWLDRGDWLSAGLVAPDKSILVEKMGKAVDEAKKAGEWNLARLRSGQMALLGLEMKAIGSVVKEGENFTNGEDAEMIWCSPGTFQMGDDEVLWYANQHEVTLSHGFWMGKHEVTQAFYQAVMGTNPSTNLNSGPKAPAENFSWPEAVEFCQKLTDRERSRGTIPQGWEYALPTEAQWEYACRAGTQTKWSFGDDESQLHRYGNFNDKSGNFTDNDDSQDDKHERTAPVGSYLPNKWGFHDMHGNVYEWTRDSIDLENPKYPEGKSTDPYVSEGAGRVNRGGSYVGTAARCRSALRDASLPSLRFSSLGLRPVLVPFRTGR